MMRMSQRIRIALIIVVAFTISLMADVIHDAALNGDLAGVKALIEEDPQLIHATDSEGRTPLHRAAEGVHYEIVVFLVGNGADVNALDNSRQAPLHLTAFHGNKEVAEFLISKGADISDADIRDFTPLHYALALRQNEVAALLIKKGADLNKKNSYGMTPFYNAIDFGQKDLVNLMIDFDVEIPTQGEEAAGLLHKAAENGLDKLVKRMIEKGVNTSTTNGNGGTLLHSISSGGIASLIPDLLDNGFNINEKDRYGLTPLHLASYSAQQAVVETLLENGADPDIRDIVGRSPLNLASQNGHTKVVEYLKSKGADTSVPEFPVLQGDYVGQKRPGIATEIFALGVISSMEYEHSAPAFSPDGNEVYWTVLSRSGKIYSMKRINGRWTAPEITAFSGTHADFYPFFSHEGNRLYYCSYRPIEEGEKNDGYGINIWYVERSGETWTEPKPVGSPINTGYNFGFSMAQNGTLYFTLGGGSSFDIYRSELTGDKYAEPEKLPEPINSEHHEDRPFIAPDERYLIFDSARPNASGGSGGLFICYRKDDGSWTDAIYMDETLSSGSPASFPYVSPDGKYFFFGSRKNGNNDIYWMDARIIDTLKYQKTDDKKDTYLGHSPPGLTPEVFAPGIVSTEYRDHSDVLFLPDADEVYWSFVIDRENGGIRFSRLEDGQWTSPDYTSFSSSDYRDCISTYWAEKKRLFYCSMRPMEEGKGGGDYNIWFVNRIGNGWSEPIPLSAPINGPKHDSNPAIANDGTLYFSSDRAGDEWYSYDIFKCEFVDGQFTEPQPLSESINTEYGEVVTFVAPDESYLIFTSFGRHDGHPYGDIFISFRKEDGTWSKAIPMGETINAGKGAGGGYVSSDGKYFFFINENVGNGDVYWVDAKIIEALNSEY